MKNRFLLLFNLLLIFSLLTCVTDNGGSNPDGNGTETSPGTTFVDEYKVTPQVYEETFDEVTLLVKKLNRVIAAGKFKNWKAYLSGSYIRKYSNRETLTEISEKSVLKTRNIKLKKLEDYFKHVVGPSRSNVKVDEIKFKDENKVTVYMIFGEKRAVLYQLEKINGEWKISTW